MRSVGSGEERQRGLGGGARRRSSAAFLRKKISAAMPWFKVAIFQRLVTAFPADKPQPSQNLP